MHLARLLARTSGYVWRANVATRGVGEHEMARWRADLADVATVRLEIGTLFIHLNHFSAKFWSAVSISDLPILYSVSYPLYKYPQNSFPSKPRLDSWT